MKNKWMTLVHFSSNKTNTIGDIFPVLYIYIYIYIYIKLLSMCLHWLQKKRWLYLNLGCILLEFSMTCSCVLPSVLFSVLCSLHNSFSF